MSVRRRVLPRPARTQLGGRVRPSARLAPVVVVGLLAFANAVVWALVTPSFEGPDEYAHAAYAVDIAERGQAPRPSSKGNFTSTENVFALDATNSFAVIRSPATRPPWTIGSQRAFDQRVQREHPRRDDGGGGQLTTSVHGPVYYFLPALAYKLAGGTFFSRLFAMRLASALMAAVAAMCAYGIVRELLPPPRPRWPAVAAGLLVGFEPMFGFMAGVVNTDNGVNAAASALLYVLVRALRRGLTPRLAVAIPAIFVFGTMAKATMISLAPVVGLALLILVRRGSGDRPAWGVLAGASAGVAGAWAAIAAVVDRPFLALPSAGPTAAHATVGQTLSYLWQVFLPPLPFMTDLYHGPGRVPAWTIYVKEVWGAFGWASLPFPNRVFRVIGVVLLVLAILAVVTLVREWPAVRARLPELLLLAFAFVCVAGFMHLAFVRTQPFGTDIGEQGRYLFPAITVPAVAAVGACYGLGRRRAPLVATALVGAMLLLSAFSQLFVFTSYFT